MNFIQWAMKWGIPMEAIADLRLTLGMDAPATPDHVKTESAASKQVRLTAAQQGHVLWRNNVGATQDDKGNYIRYGLANDSKAMNTRIKSSDLVGIRSDGIFMARECKAPGWVYKGTPREEAQLRYITLVNTHGGDAKFSTGEL